jgi:hypothetical protein
MFEKIPGVKKIIIHYWVHLKHIENHKKWEEEADKMASEYKYGGSFRGDIREEIDKIVVSGINNCRGLCGYGYKIKTV